MSNAAAQTSHVLFYLIFFFLLLFFKILFIYSSMRDREREAETQAEGEAGSMQGADVGLDTGTRSRVSRIRPWAEGSTKPLSHEGCPILSNFQCSLRSRAVISILQMRKQA